MTRPVICFFCGAEEQPNLDPSLHAFFGRLPLTSIMIPFRATRTFLGSSSALLCSFDLLPKG